MPIYEVTETDMLRRCASCHEARRYPFTALTVGVERRGVASPGIIPLPACTCGSVEYLVRVPDTDPPHPAPGSFGHLHAMLVQELHRRLLIAGRLSPDLANETPPVVAGPGLDAATKQRWFPNGLKIEVREQET
jgi:hypothetical protein